MLLLPALLALFVIPGYLLVCWLHSEDALDLPIRLVLGWAWSFAGFSILAAPFLWMHRSVASFLTVAGSLWIAATAVAGILFLRRFRRASKIAGTTLPNGLGSQQSDRSQRGPAAAPSLPRPTKKPGAPGAQGRDQAEPAKAAGVIALYAAFSGVVLALWSNSGPDRHAWVTVCLPAIVAGGALLGLALQRYAGPMLCWNSRDDDRPPRFWSVLAGVVILCQAIGSVAYNRPDWDDCYYLAAALDYQQGAILNDQEPTHREGFPVQAIYLLMTWELWGATLGRLAGVGPLVLFHSALPVLVVLGCYAAYRAVLAELLPRRWVPLALLGLCGFHFWGISNLGNASNHFLIRVWQGKAVLLHLGLPLTMWALLRFARKPLLHWWLTLCACLAIGPGLSSSAIFLSSILVSCLTLVLIPTAPAGRRVAFILGSGIALLPTIGVGLLIWLAVRGDPAYQPESTLTPWQSWFREWDRYAGRGSAEVVWLTVLPLVWLLTAGWRSRAVLVGLPVLLLATFGNPLLQAFISGHLTGAVTYYRLFWLFPVGLGLAVFLALGSRLAGKLASARLGVNSDRLSLGACATGLIVSAALPGVWVWSAANQRDPFMTPRTAKNLEQMPPDLKVIANRLADDPDIEERRIACGEEVASFLTPFDRHFRFAVTRPGYTMYSVGRSRGAAETAERLYLTEALWQGPGFPRLPEESWRLIVRTVGGNGTSPRPEAWPSLENLSLLLDRYNVKYAIASPVLGDTPDRSRLRVRIRDVTLRKNGFRQVYEGESYSLWKRDRGTAAAVPATSKFR